MHKHSAIQDSDGVYALHRDGRILNCPKTVYPNFMQSQLDGKVGVQLLRFACSTSCPFAEVKEIVEVVEENKQVTKKVYEIGCEGRGKTIVLDEVVEFKKPGIVSPMQIVGK